ncbi:MAG: HAD-IA family hydrolase [Prevotella sp.]|nr:HAD-IA family hydrolase [Prevotella sp.]
MNEVIKKCLEKHGFEQFCPKAVLFDMDGVIYDSMPNHSVSWHDSMKDFGLDMPYEGAYQYEGMRGVETIKTLARAQWNRELSDEEAKKMYAHKAEVFANQCQLTPARIMPGIKTLMQHIKDNGWKICVVTGSAQHALLDKLLIDFEGLLKEELIVTAFDVKHGKPNPEPYLIGMQKCRVEPFETMVVENAPLGVRAAVAARCFTIAVNTGPLPDEMLQQEGANLTFPRMTALAQTYHQWYPSAYRAE